MRNVLRFAAVFSILSVAATGCSGSAPSSSPAEVGKASTAAAAPAPVAAPSKPHAVAGFSGVADKNANTLVFTRDPAPAASSPFGLNDKITPESISTVSDPQTGNPSGNEVDLVTIGACTNLGAGSTFSCNVELVSYFSRTLTNVYVQVDTATPSTGYDMQVPTGSCYWYAQNGDDPSCNTGGGAGTNFTASEFESNNGVNSLPVDHGLWWYNNADANAQAIWPVIEPSGTVNGSTKLDRATVQWVFENQSNQSVYYHFTVYATEAWNTFDPFEGSGFGGDSYGDEGGNSTPGGDDDACNGATTVINAANTCTGSHCGNEGASMVGFAAAASITLPFDFTLFKTNSKNWVVCPYVGWLTTSAANCPNAAKAAPTSAHAFPSSNYPSEQIFAPFWAEMEYGTSTNDQSPFDSTKAAGQICMKQLAGTTAPNRIEVIEWRNMDLPAGVGDSLDFEMFLYEGTNEIDVSYVNMVKASGDSTDIADCAANCYVGYQGNDIAGFNGGSTALSGLVDNGTGLTSTGAAYQFLALP